MLDPIPELPDNTLISDVEFPARIRQVLSAASLKTVGEVREVSDEVLLTFPDFGKASISHLRETLGLPSADGVRPLGGRKSGMPRSLMGSKPWLRCRIGARLTDDISAFRLMRPTILRLRLKSLRSQP